VVLVLLGSIVQDNDGWWIHPAIATYHVRGER
jgi:hypothetical protein